MEKEIRNYNLSEVRSLEDSRKIEGYAAVFDSESQNLGGWVEVIDRNAFDGVVAESDVYALLNHSNDRGILARSRYGVGTLTLSIDERGLKYEFEAPNTALGDEVLEYLKRGDITQSSFAFTVNSDSWEKRGDIHLRTIKKVERLYDVSPVFEPAYLGTSVKCARYSEIVEEERLAAEEAMRKADEEKRAAIADYYKSLKAEYSQYMPEPTSE